MPVDSKPKPIRTPDLCRHKGRALGYVTWNGKELYFKDSEGRGIPWPASHKRAPEPIRLAYDAFLSDIHSGRTPAPGRAKRITVKEICLKFLKHTKESKTRHDWLTFRAAIRPLVRSQGHKAVLESDPRPVDWLEFQNYLVVTPIVRKQVVGGNRKRVAGKWVREGAQEVRTERPRNRNGVNKVMKRIREVWRWAVRMKRIPASCLEDIKSVTAVRQQQPDDDDDDWEGDDAPIWSDEELLPVDDDVVRKTLEHLPRILQAMVRLQRLTAMRPGELCRIRMKRIDRRDPDCWWYHPKRHKNAWRGRGRAIPLGPQCQEILRGFLRADPGKPLFSPADRMAEWREEQRAKRKTRVQPSQVDRAKSEPRKGPGNAYTTASYGRAIKAACKKAGVPDWSPNQLRKAAADEILNKCNEDHARALLGHSHAGTTRRAYAVRDRAKARVAQAAIAGV